MKNFLLLLLPLLSVEVVGAGDGLVAAQYRLNPKSSHAFRVTTKGNSSLAPSGKLMHGDRVWVKDGDLHLDYSDGGSEELTPDNATEKLPKIVRIRFSQAALARLDYYQWHYHEAGTHSRGGVDEFFSYPIDKYPPSAAIFSIQTADTAGMGHLRLSYDGKALYQTNFKLGTFSSPGLVKAAIQARESGRLPVILEVEVAGHVHHTEFNFIPADQDAALLQSLTEAQSVAEPERTVLRAFAFNRYGQFPLEKHELIQLKEAGLSTTFIDAEIARLDDYPDVRPSDEDQ